MLHRLKQCVVGTAAFAAFSLAASIASAEYVCSVYYEPPTSGSGYGTSGHVYVLLYTGPSCTGGFARTGFLCTGSSTSTFCSATHRYSSTSILALFESLQRASAADQLISYGWTPCNGGGGNCLATIYFQSN